MGFLDRLFPKSVPTDNEPDIRFGRYSDSYKEEDNYEAWHAAVDAFTEEAFLESFERFFKYLRDEEEDNVYWTRENGVLKFELFQGSKRIFGMADERQLAAEAKIAYAVDFDVPFSRRLLEKNFDLKYSRFALDEQQNLCIVFDTSALDGSPYKLYRALKELAVNADKQDDLLLDEFKHALVSVEDKHIQSLSEEEKEVKYAFILQKIKEVLAAIENSRLSPTTYPGAISYQLLSLTYSLDYLIKPEGYMMEALERIHRRYFEKNKLNNSEKNEQMQAELVKLLERPKSAFFKEFYLTKATFGITSPENHARVADFIQMELHNMDWYYDNQHFLVAKAIPDYIVGYCMFNYALPKPDRDLFRLYYRIIEGKFFEVLGFGAPLYNTNTQQFDKKGIRRAIEEIRWTHQKKYPHFRPIVQQLNYQDLTSFVKSYLEMVRELDLSKQLN
jgi:hypothetical protein